LDVRLHTINIFSIRRLSIPSFLSGLQLLSRRRLFLFSLLSHL